jgi:DNA-binding transcriptional ArsR family regulator
MDELSLTFSALADPTRRAILARLAEGEATVNELAAPFELQLPTISKHLKMLENAGLVSSERRGQFVLYKLVRDNLVNSLSGYALELCPVGRPLKRESRAIAKKRKTA